MKTLVYRIHLQPEPEGGYTVTVPTLPGCVTWGRDYDHAMEMAKECIGGYLEALVKAGQPVPIESSLTEPIDAVIQVKTSVAA